MVICLTTSFIFGGATYPVIKWLKLESIHMPYQQLSEEERNKHLFTRIDKL